MILLGGLRAGGNKSHLPSGDASSCAGPRPAGGLLPAAVWRGPADLRAGETVRGLVVSASVLRSWLGIREGPAVGNSRANTEPPLLRRDYVSFNSPQTSLRFVAINQGSEVQSLAQVTQLDVIGEDSNSCSLAPGPGVYEWRDFSGRRMCAY